MRYVSLACLTGAVLVGMAYLPEDAPAYADLAAAPKPLVGALPKHLEHWGGLFLRVGDDVHFAPPEDVEVAKRYPRFPSKGKLTAGQRCTILTAKTRCRVGEPVRVIHVHEVTEPGQWVYVMGPKPIYREFVDGRQITPDAPRIRFIMGLVVDSPTADYNYDITEYRFARPGRYYIQWRNGCPSNVLVIEVH